MLDQALFAPCFITTFFVTQALLEDQKKSQILKKLGDVNINSLKNNTYFKDNIFKLILNYFFFFYLSI